MGGQNAMRKANAATSQKLTSWLRESLTVSWRYHSAGERGQALSRLEYEKEGLICFKLKNLKYIDVNHLLGAIQKMEGFGSEFSLVIALSHASIML